LPEAQDLDRVRAIQILGDGLADAERQALEDRPEPAVGTNITRHG
jgi:hypothetical protein